MLALTFCSEIGFWPKGQQSLTYHARYCASLLIMAKVGLGTKTSSCFLGGRNEARANAVTSYLSDIIRLGTWKDETGACVESINKCVWSTQDGTAPHPGTSTYWWAGQRALTLQSSQPGGVEEHVLPNRKWQRKSNHLASVWRKMKAKWGNQCYVAWEDTVKMRLFDAIQVYEELLSVRGRRPSPPTAVQKEPRQLLGKNLNSKTQKNGDKTRNAVPMKAETVR